jgi:hypothetical protein
LSDDEQTLFCTIEDNGIGYNKGREKNSIKPAFQSHRSRGMEITRDRLSLLHQLKKKHSGSHVVIIDLGEETNGLVTGTKVEVCIPIIDAIK